MERRKVKDFEGYYVSDTGIVKTDHYLGRKGDIKNLSYSDRDGYYMCYPSKNGKKYAKGVHVLVAEAFIPNPENKRTVNHKNGDKHDNRVENLERATDSENCKHRFIGLKQKAIYHGGDKKPVIRITKSGEEEFDSLKDAHKKTGTRINSIRDVCNGKQNTAGGYKWKWGVYDPKRHNKAYNKAVEYNGKWYASVSQLCNELNLNYSTIQGRLKAGQNIESAINWNKGKKFKRTRYEKQFIKL